MKTFLRVIAGWLLSAGVALGQPVSTNGMPAVIERGTYHNYFSCQNPAYGVFAHFGDDSGSDSRLGQLLIGWDTTQSVTTNRPATRYLIRHCRVSITLNNGNQVTHDPTRDDYRTFLDTNDVAWLPDPDAGRPIELFGAGFRNGFSPTNFSQCSTVGSGEPGTNNVFAISWTTNGVPVDIGSNIGKTLPEFPPFETWPFAVAQTSNAAPGSLMPTGARLTFDVNLDDPFTVGYLQRSLQQGRLDFMVSSLHQVSGQFGSEPYPTFTTRFNQAILNPPTTMDLEVSIVRDLDSEPDGLPDDWEMFYFGDLDEFAGSDPDGDGASNLVEYESGTEPTQAASVFQIAAVRRNTAGEAVLQWPNLPSRNFVVEFGDAFSNWQTVANPPLIFHSPAIAEWTDTSGTNGTHFYRVRAIAD